MACRLVTGGQVQREQGGKSQPELGSNPDCSSWLCDLRRESCWAGEGLLADPGRTLKG